MRVLITGASKGIGKAIALKLQHTYSLILHASKQDTLDTLFKELENPGEHAVLCADFSDHGAVKSFCSELKQKYSEDLYCVINNAGITLDKSLLFQPEADIDKILAVNLKAPVMISKTAFKIFHSRKKGIIVNMGSYIGETGNAFQSIYAATKAGLVAFSESLAKETGVLLQEHEIRVFSISPGYIETPMTGKIPEVEKRKYLENIPSRRMGQPSEVANLVAFLLSKEAAYINGSQIKINGGIA